MNTLFIVVNFFLISYILIRMWNEKDVERLVTVNFYIALVSLVYALIQFL